MALVELSSDGELGREIFAHPDADMIGVVGDYTRSEVIGAIYEREGLPSFHYFDSFAARYQRSLEQAFPGRAVSITGASRDQRILVVRTEGPRDPGTFYVLDTETNRARLVGKAMPWLDRAELAPVEALRVAADDGTELDVFVTRPRPERTSGVRPPLVVLPHGGPVGVRDTRSFDPLVQYLADGGIAVLQVNYRGSGGRGETFLDAGKRQWAKGIEDDIEAALRAVVDRGWADPKRVCIAGGSYGGYSALISIAQRPELYRCAASINGPSDVPLQLFHFGFARSETRREQLTELIGDPREDYDELRAISPVYLAERMQVPVLLIHGSDDRRVDVEHFHRMRLTLQALGKPHETLLIAGGGHSPTTREWKEIARRLRLFLRRHLVDG